MIVGFLRGGSGSGSVDDAAVVDVFLKLKMMIWSCGGRRGRAAGGGVVVLARGECVVVRTVTILRVCGCAGGGSGERRRVRRRACLSWTVIMFSLRRWQ